MHGKIIQFKADIDNFKVKNGTVTVNLTADVKNIVLDQLSDISQGAVMVHLEASQTEMIPEETKKNADN